MTITSCGLSFRAVLHRAAAGASFLVHSFAQDRVDAAEMPFTLRLKPSEHVGIDPKGNLSLERPVVFADDGVLPFFGRKNGSIRIGIVETFVPLFIESSGFVADFQPL